MTMINYRKPDADDATEKASATPRSLDCDESPFNDPTATCGCYCRPCLRRRSPSGAAGGLLLCLAMSLAVTPAQLSSRPATPRPHPTHAVRHWGLPLQPERTTSDEATNGPKISSRFERCGHRATHFKTQRVRPLVVVVRLICGRTSALRTRVSKSRALNFSIDDRAHCAPPTERPT